MFYGAQELEAAFRTVRKNTITIAEEIPADKYTFKAAPDVKSVGEMLAHLAVSPGWQLTFHRDGVTAIDFAMFSAVLAKAAAEEQTLDTKDRIITALRENGEQFAAFLGSLSPEKLAETVSFPPPMQPSQKTRFELLLAAKEHEMHHRGQLMLIERLLGIVPHITRQRQAMQAGARA